MAVGQTYMLHFEAANNLYILRMVSLILWYLGFSLGVPSAIIALCAQTKKGKQLAIGVTTLAISLVCVGDFALRAMTYGGSALEMRIVRLGGTAALTLFTISILMILTAFFIHNEDKEPVAESDKT